MAYKPIQESKADSNQLVPAGGHHHQITGKTLLLASLAGVAIGGSLLGMMGFSLLATLTLLVVTSPLLLLFSPLLIIAAFVLVSVLIGFALAAAMAYVGLTTLAWIIREVRGKKEVSLYDERGIKEGGKGLDGYLQQKVQQFSTGSGVNHG